MFVWLCESRFSRALERRLCFGRRSQGVSRDFCSALITSSRVSVFGHKKTPTIGYRRGSFVCCRLRVPVLTVSAIPGGVLNSQCCEQPQPRNERDRGENEERHVPECQHHRDDDQYQAHPVSSFLHRGVCHVGDVQS